MIMNRLSRFVTIKAGCCQIRKTLFGDNHLSKKLTLFSFYWPLHQISIFFFSWPVLFFYGRKIRYKRYILFSQLYFVSNPILVLENSEKRRVSYYCQRFDEKIIKWTFYCFGFGRFFVKSKIVLISCHFTWVGHPIYYLLILD